MNDSKGKKSNFAAISQDVDDAVGVPKSYWFIAILNSRSEKSTAEKLTRMGVENYLPIMEEVHVWKTGKKAKVTRVMIPAKIFIRCTEQERRELVNLPFIFRFMSDPAGNRPLAIVPDHEITQLKFMLGVSDAKVTFAQRFFKGERVKVMRGPFRGLVGEILHDADRNTGRLYINIDFLGSASVEIRFADVKPADAND